MKRVLFHLSYVAAIGLLVSVFLILAQVNFDDMRLRAGRMRFPPDVNVSVGGFYSLQSNGDLDGPLCLVQTDALIDQFDQSLNTMRVSNWLGESLPIIVRWTRSLSTLLGMEEVSKPNEDGTPWEGYTLVRKIDDNRIKAASLLPGIIDRSFKSDPNCERTVGSAAERGECVVVVTRVARDITEGGSNFGFGITGQRNCIVSNRMTAAMVVPAPPFRLISKMSLVKDRLGLIE